MRDSTIGRTLRHWHWLIWGTSLVAGIVALGVSFGRQPNYEATALLSIDQTQETGQGFDLAMQADQFLSQRFISMATSRTVLQAVCAKEGPDCSPAALSRQVRTATPKATAQIQIVADAPTPSGAARIANDVADAVVARNQQQVDGQLASQRKYLQDQLKQVSDQLNRTAQQLQTIEASGRTDAVLASQLTLQQTQYSNTYQRLQDLEVQRSKLSSVISVADRAAPPATPTDPDPMRYVLVGATAGLIAGLLAALAMERLRGRIHDGSELAEAASSQVVLDLSGRRAVLAPNPYGLLVHAIRAGNPAGAGALLLAATSTGAGVNDVGLGLARALTSDFKRLLVVLATSGDESAPERRQIGDGTSSTIVVVSGGHPEPDQGETFDQIICCTLPPLQDGGYAWLRQAPGRAILVATRKRSRFSEVRRTAELLRHLGMELVGTVLLPTRMKRRPKAPQREPERAQVDARPVRPAGGATTPEPLPPSPAENAGAPQAAAAPEADHSVPHWPPPGSHQQAGDRPSAGSALPQGEPGRSP